MGEPELGSYVGGVRLDEVIGRGGMGVVFKGHDPALNRTVAVKVVREHLAGNEEFGRRFRHECEVAASLDHPHVVPIYSAGDDDGRLYVVMRYVDGKDLRDTIVERGPLPVAGAVQIIEQVGSALDAAHGRGLVHRDVKPANVLVTSVGGNPHTYLTDFGLTRVTSDSPGLTSPGAVLGTFDYMAPEQYEADSVDRRADGYALACVFYEMVTGHVPFPRESGMAKMSAHLFEAPPRVGLGDGALGARLDAVLARALAKKPADRFATAGELGRALSAVLGEQTTVGASAAASAGSGAAAPTGTLTTVVVDRPGAVPQSLVPTYAGPRPSAASLSAPPSAPPSDRPSGPPSGVGPWRPGVSYPPGGSVPPPRGSVPPGSPSSPGGTARSAHPWAAGPVPPPALSSPGSAPGSAPGGPPSGGGRRRWWVVALAVVVVLALVGAGVGITAALTTSTRVAEPPPVPPVQPVPAATAYGGSISTGRDPVDIEAGGGYTWVANKDDGTVTKIDPATGTPQTFSVGGNPTSLDVDAGGVWVSNYADGVSRLDIATGQVRDFMTGPEVSALAVGGGYAWVSDSKANNVVRINTTTLQFEGQPIPVGRAPGGLWSDNGRLYVVNTGDRSVTTIGESTGQVIRVPLVLSTDISSVFTVGGLVYGITGDFSLPDDRRPLVLTPIDPDSGLVGAPLTLTGASSVVTDDRTLWASYPFTNEIKELDPQTGAPRGLPVAGVGGRGVGDVDFVGGDLWVSSSITDSVQRAHINR